MEGKVKKSIFARSSLSVNDKGQNEDGARPALLTEEETSEDTTVKEVIIKGGDMEMEERKSSGGDGGSLLFERIWDLATAVNDGKLDVRANISGLKGTDKEILEAVNQIVDAIVKPLNVAAKYVDEISKGAIPEKITDTYKGDFNTIKNNLNNCIDGLGGLVESNAVLKRMAVNDHTKKVEGSYVGIFSSLAESTNVVRERLLAVTKQMNEIAKGDTTELAEFKKVGKRSDEDHLLPAIIEALESINLLVEDASMLSTAAVEGKLATRADATKHHGGYRKIVEGVNQTLDAVIGPLNVAAEYVDRISKGDIPPKITDNYNGDFNEIKNNLNNCIDTMSGLLAETDKLVNATVAGQLATRGDAAKFAGGWGTLVGGVNNLCDAFVGPINVTAEYVDRISKGDIPPKITDNYNGDFNEIKNNLNNCIDTMSGLLAETDKLVNA
ncbi:MAG: hypothetical protein WCJ37_16050, partial [Syntrophus sp. (in: bacteria)]